MKKIIFILGLIILVFIIYQVYTYFTFDFRGAIKKMYYDEFFYETCRLNPYQSSGFSSESYCAEFIECSADSFSDLVKEEDLRRLYKQMKKSGGESGSLRYFDEEPTLREQYWSDINSCPKN